MMVMMKVMSEMKMWTRREGNLEWKMMMRNQKSRGSKEKSDREEDVILLKGDTNPLDAVEGKIAVVESGIGASRLPSRLEEMMM